MKVARSAESGHARDPIKVPTTSLEYDFSVVIDGQVCISPGNAAPDDAPKADRIRNARLFAAAPELYLAAKMALLRSEWMGARMGDDGMVKSRLEQLAESLGWKAMSPNEPLFPWIDSYTTVAVLLAEEGSPA